MNIRSSQLIELGIKTPRHVGESIYTPSWLFYCIILNNISIISTYYLFDPYQTGVCKWLLESRFFEKTALLLALKSAFNHKLKLQLKSNWDSQAFVQAW